MKALIHLSTATGPLTPIEVTLDPSVPLHLIPGRAALWMSGLLGEPVCCTGFHVTADALRVVS